MVDGSEEYRVKILRIVCASDALQHAIQGVAPFLVPFSRFIGGPASVREWDECTVITHPLRTTMGHLFTWLPKLQSEGAESRDVAFGSSNAATPLGKTKFSFQAGP